MLAASLLSKAVPFARSSSSSNSNTNPPSQRGSPRKSLPFVHPYAVLTLTGARRVRLEPRTFVYYEVTIQRPSYEKGEGSESETGVKAEEVREAEKNNPPPPPPPTHVHTHIPLRFLTPLRHQTKMYKTLRLVRSALLLG